MTDDAKNEELAPRQTEIAPSGGVSGGGAPRTHVQHHDDGGAPFLPQGQHDTGFPGAWDAELERHGAGRAANHPLVRQEPEPADAAAAANGHAIRQQTCHSIGKPARCAVHGVAWPCPNNRKYVVDPGPNPPLGDAEYQYMFVVLIRALERGTPQDFARHEKELNRRIGHGYSPENFAVIRSEPGTNPEALTVKRASDYRALLEFVQQLARDGHMHPWGAARKLLNLMGLKW